MKKYLLWSFVLPSLIFSKIHYDSVQENYHDVLQAYQYQEWSALVRATDQLLDDYPETAFGKEALFYQAVALYEQKDYDLANEKFSEYLKKSTSPKFFEKTMEYKLKIADAFRNGAKGRLFGVRKLPKFFNNYGLALEIYEEVASTITYHDLGVRALFGKAELEFLYEDYKESIEGFQQLIQRFPKHDLALQSFLMIQKVHLAQAKMDRDPSFLDLARVNLKKFQQAFPGESEILAQMNQTLLDIQEVYASELIEIAKFFEKTSKIPAAKIYYSKVERKYPETPSAQFARQRLEHL